jgi:outer membrane protein OmpA-like peptidoglycan-associated protein
MPRGRWIRVLAIFVVHWLGFLPMRELTAQTVVQLQGDGSSLVNGYGATANFWRPGSDGWLGIGYVGGLRIGAFLRTGLGRDTLRLGNDVLQVRFPTDIFGSGHNLLVQGLGYAGGNERTSYYMFGGASSSGLGAQSFQPTSLERPLSALFLQHRLSPALRLTGTAVVAERQTAVPGLEWQVTPDLTTALAAGVGSDRPYAASSLIWRPGRFGARASYAWNSTGFHRVAVPTPYQTETDRENVQLTYDLLPAFTIGVGRQNFVQDSADSRPAARASGNSVFAGGRLSDWRVTGGLYDSRSEGLRNLSSYFALGRELTSWVDAEVFLLQSRPTGRPASTTPLANLRWRLSPQVGLMQQISYQDGRATILFGASLATALGDFGVDYEIVHQPFQPLRPFRSALNLRARLQLGSYSTSFGTSVRPDGAVDYSASGSTFLYLGSSTGAQPLVPAGGGIAKYVVRGTVCDAGGAPVEGAALDLGGQIVFTNSEGAFFMRDARMRRLPLTVLVHEFLLPGRWEVAAAPLAVESRPERQATPVEVVLRRAGATALAPGPPLSPIAPASAAAPTDEPPVGSATRAVETIDLDREILAPHRTPVHFGWGSRRLPAAFRSVLDSLALRLAATPELIVEVQGHADSTGSRRANLRLSRVRAEAVRRYFEARGVRPGQVISRGLGDTRPLADNRTTAGRAQNRRVELHQSEAADSARTNQST